MPAGTYFWEWTNMEVGIIIRLGGIARTSSRSNPQNSHLAIQTDLNCWSDCWSNMLILPDAALSMAELGPERLELASRFQCLNLESMATGGTPEHGAVSSVRHSGAAAANDALIGWVTGTPPPPLPTELARRAAVTGASTKYDTNTNVLMTTTLATHSRMQLRRENGSSTMA